MKASSQSQPGDLRRISERLRPKSRSSSPAPRRTRPPRPTRPTAATTRAAGADQKPVRKSRATATPKPDPAPGVDGQAPGRMQLPRPSAWPAPAAERLAFPGELLHAVVAVLGDVERAVGSEGEVVGQLQLPRLLARRPPVAHQLAVARED